MDRYYRYYLTIGQEDYERAYNILEHYYYRGDVEHISVETKAHDRTVMIGLECSTDDLLSLKNDFKENGIVAV